MAKSWRSRSRIGPIDIKKRQDTQATHPEAVFAHKVVRSHELADALVRIGEYVADHGIEGQGPYQAARDLLLRAPPRVGGQALTQPERHRLQAAVRLAPHLEAASCQSRGRPAPARPTPARG